MADAMQPINPRLDFATAFAPHSGNFAAKQARGRIIRTIALDSIQNPEGASGIAEFVKFAHDARLRRRTRPRTRIFSKVEKLAANASPPHKTRPERLENSVARAAAAQSAVNEEQSTVHS